MNKPIRKTVKAKIVKVTDNTHKPEKEKSRIEIILGVLFLEFEERNNKRNEELEKRIESLEQRVTDLEYELYKTN